MPGRRLNGEGAVYYWEQKNLWVAQMTLPNGKRPKKYGRTKREVKAWLVEQNKLLSSGNLIENNKITLNEFIDRWMIDVAIHRLRPSTLNTHESIIRNHVKPTVGHLQLKDISPVHLQLLYSDKLKSGLSKRTVKYIHTILHQSLDQATKWGLVARNVANAVDSPTPDRKPVKPLIKEDVTKLFDALANDRLFPLYVVFLGCGLRRGEALALTVEDVDFDRGELHIRKTLQALKGEGLVTSEPKTARSRRTVAMPDFVRAALLEHLAKRKVESKYVFCTVHGTPFSPRNVLRHFKIILRRAGLSETIRIHDLRHTFVSYLLSKNTPPRDVQEIVGHASFSTTVDIYGHLMPGAKTNVAKKMDEFFRDIGSA